jgi:hypothetical protein
MVIVARDPGRGAAVRDEIAETGNRDVALEIADLGRSIGRASPDYWRPCRIHVLVSNAGLT